MIRRSLPRRRFNERFDEGTTRMRMRVLLGGSALGLLVGLWPRRARAVARSGTFEPATVARLEVAGWRAYYARNPIAALAVLWRLTRGQFAMPVSVAVRSAYAAVRAQVAFVGKRGRRDTAFVWLTRFYALAPRRDGSSPFELAQAEIEYWVQHRHVVHQSDQSPLVDALAELHALLFGGTPAEMRASAQERALACQAVDRITGHVSANVARDWELAEAHLRRAYQLAVAVGLAHARELAVA